jgi:methylated-DNA-[protein]-cysteine S-methyltransferase
VNNVDQRLTDEMLKDDEPVVMDGTPDERAVEAALRAVRPAVTRALRRIRRPLVRAGVIDVAPLGRLLVAESVRGLMAVRFLDSLDPSALLSAIRARFDLIEDRDVAIRTQREIERYLSGDMRALDRPVDLSLVETEFQRRALTRLRRSVPPGSVITYQALAAAVGAPSGQRAIGNTMAMNPVPLYVPCHRVVRSDGTVGEYGGGVERKLRLLRTEGFSVDRDQRLPGTAVLGHLQTHIFCRPRCRAAMRADRARMLIFADSEHARGAGMRACRMCRPTG